MKKRLLIFLLVFTTSFVNAQFVLSILPPSEYEGNYDFFPQWDDGSWLNIPDMNDPANAILENLVVVRDGTPTADSAGCEALINPDEIAGKIALAYRGDCNFDQKMLMAQNAGAIGLIIVNRLGEQIDFDVMSCVDLCAEVTIPAVLIEGAAVVDWRPEIDAGVMIAFIGNKNGLFDNDLGIIGSGVLRAEHFSHPRVLAQAADEYTVLLGSEIINYGVNDQSSVTLSAEILLDGNVLYNETTETPQTIASGDTLFFDLPSFAQEPFQEGFYEMTYSVNFENDDEFPSDNTNMANFMISDSLFSYSRVDKDSGLPNGISHLRPSTATASVQSCITFQDPNASKVIVEGLTFSATYGGDDMTDVTMDAYLYEWTNEFTDIDDPNFDLTTESAEELNFGSYEYPSADLEAAKIYIPFEEGATSLQDDVRYLFCINYFDEDVFTGFDNVSMDYTQNLDIYLQPLWPLDNDGDWSAVIHFGLDNCPAISVNMKDPLYDAINEEVKRVEITPFPNPTANEINIPVGNNYGQTMIDVYDIAGKKVKSLNVTTTSFEVLKVNVSDLDNGAYIFKMNFEDGSFSNFNVVVNN